MLLRRKQIRKEIIMNYGTCNESKLENACCAEPMESLTDMMKSTNCIAQDALRMARRINAHLFGIGNPCCEKEAEPKCFRDELVATKCELLATVEELAKICAMLGV